MIDSVTNVTVNKIEDDLLAQKNISLFIQREDLIHPEISGNKWRKLKYYLKKYRDCGHQSIVTFGGSSSNHIAATAAAGKIYNIPTHGIIRGEDKSHFSNTLQLAMENGMQLHFVSREEYNLKTQLQYLQSLSSKFEKPLIVPEGGGGHEGIIGCSEITDIFTDFDIVFSACGTGATLAGLILNLKNKQIAIGIPVLKNAFFLKDEIQKMIEKIIPKSFNWELQHEYHFGGYAKYSEEILLFIKDFYLKHHIKLDPIYTGKMMYAIYDLIQKKDINNCKILAIDTGGLQGIPDFERRYKKTIFH